MYRTKTSLDNKLGICNKSTISFDKKNKQININHDFGIDGQGFYSYIMDVFSESDMMQYSIPIMAQKPNMFTFINGWSLSGNSLRKLKNCSWDTHSTNIEDFYLVMNEFILDPLSVNFLEYKIDNSDWTQINVSEVASSGVRFSLTNGSHERVEGVDSCKSISLMMPRTASSICFRTLKNESTLMQKIGSMLMLTEQYEYKASLLGKGTYNTYFAYKGLI